MTAKTSNSKSAADEKEEQTQQYRVLSRMFVCVYVRVQSMIWQIALSQDILFYQFTIIARQVLRINIRMCRRIESEQGGTVVSMAAAYEVEKIYVALSNSTTIKMHAG